MFQPSRLLLLVLLMGCTTLQAQTDFKVFVEGLTFQQPDGSSFSFAAVEGKVLLLDFWATWCRPCRKQHLTVAALHQSINDPDFVLINVSIDHHPEQWAAFLKAMPWKGINIHLDRAQHQSLFQLVQESLPSNNGEPLFKMTIPQYYLVDRSFRIFKIDDPSDPAVKAQILRLLAG